MDNTSETQKPSIGDALKAYFEALRVLQEQGVLINKKDFTSQIGEWLVETIYEGKRATSGIQKGWDIEVGGKYIQVKTHAKSLNNNNRWSNVDHDSTNQIHELIIIDFTPDYKIRKFYKAPWDDAKKHFKLRGKAKKFLELNWSSIDEYAIELDDLPRQDIISIFK